MRRKDREVTNIDEIKAIVRGAKVCRVAMTDGVQPYIVPMHYGYHFDEANRLTIYVHCAHEGRKLDILRANNRVCVEIEGETTLISGGDQPCKYGAAFSSVIGFGQAFFITDLEEKKAALSALMQAQTGRQFDFNEAMCASVTVLAFCLDEYTAKRREAPAQ